MSPVEAKGAALILLGRARWRRGARGSAPVGGEEEGEVGVSAFELIFSREECGGC